MKKEQFQLDLPEMNTSELISTCGGGEADDLAYYVTHALVTTNPLILMARYSKWVLTSLI